MKISVKSVVAFLSVLLLLFLVWYFRNIVAYILISGVLSIMGRPLVELMCKIRIKKFKFPRALSALITLFVIWGFIFLFMWVFVPLVTRQINYFATIDSAKIVQLIEEPLVRLEAFFRTFNAELSNDITIREYLTQKVTGVLNINLLQNFLGSAFGIAGNILITIFALSFITFFFLKDQHLFYESILMWIPDKHTEAFTRALNSISHLLTRYFVGILCQSTCIMIIIDIGMTIAGIDFQQALVMGLIIGILNIIPYIGPWIGFFIALIMGVGSHINMDFQTVVWPLMIYMAIVVAITQTIDNIFFQPIIYSNSVKAHPLEIFVVVLAFGSFAGVGGMILGIPSYTVLRVLAKEFFNNFKAVQKITSSLDDDDSIKKRVFRSREKDQPEPPVVNTEK
jgi:predicted PurR-regulated permease PerM